MDEQPSVALDVVVISVRMLRTLEITVELKGILNISPKG